MAPVRSRLRLVIVVAVIAVLGLGALAWFTLLRDQSDPALQISSDRPDTPSPIVDPATLDGTWKVVAGSADEATAAGYRVREKFAAGARKVTANGRTDEVTGTVTVEGAQVTAARITVDLTALRSDADRRDQAIRSRGLETNEFPTASFELTEPIELPQMRRGQVFTVAASGELTLHGVTKAVTIDLDAKVGNDQVIVQGSAPVVMGDHDIEPPNIAGFVSVADEGRFEFLVTLARA